MSREPKVPSKPIDQSPEPPEIIEKQIERILEGKVQRKEITAVTARITEVIVSEQFSGPMPHPKHLREYEEILPGSADRILEMAESSLSHNIAMGAEALRAEVEDSKRGMRFGALLFALLIVCAFGSILLTDREIIPGMFLGAAAVGCIGAFIKGRNGR